MPLGYAGISSPCEPAFQPSSHWATMAADWRGIDGMLLATIGLLLVALVPLNRLRSQEHEIDAANAGVQVGQASA